jgi:hypothetical protein
VNLDEIAARLPRTPHPEAVSLYAQLIGELVFFAINTQTLIAQPVNALARFMTTANSELYVLAKGVLRCLKGVKSRKIVWCASRVKFPFVPCEIYAYSDASWADTVPQRKSSLSYLIFCNNAVSVGKLLFLLYLRCHLQKLNRSLFALVLRMLPTVVYWS